ncbi:23S rRNA (guanosine(2251)-2'-O)-methyltransferase RlmB [Hymenobacter sp. 15J16-1T3B]|uniref:23S rRNA (guanosine(2251)-2'-O)-methyltransferase RlmB n=1 Tax=Hymenobacter sp. 15J16-1T3B TaxID=2886941 RepID=UPI001D114489|nr:23S rRNA (guanosine(2251)-2'-O)-methyltransferase RlmB [Hymenobacter sp. 15J16-1T3B]MCC3159205.1 23S rRNA (guanosine(2251)-2'-O)-methyltransferase RlmB [Hymenobacter sp. 15J16-1T3B]
MENRQERPRPAGRPLNERRPDYKKYPPRQAQDRSIEMVFGLRPIMEALQAGKTLEKIYLLKGAKNTIVSDISALARAAGTPISLVPNEKLDNLTRKNHQGAVAFLSPIDYAPLDNILPTLFEQGKSPLILLLDRITDVRNFGAIARSAECLGVDAIVVPTHGAAQMNGDALKTSAGALTRVPVCRESNLHATLRRLKDSGLQVVACTEKGNETLEKASIDMTGPLVVVMGSEEDGISPELQELADARIRIPMIGQIGSLNVSVASGILLYEVLRQRLVTPQE